MAGFFVFAAHAQAADTVVGQKLQIFGADGQVKSSFVPFEDSLPGSVTSADLGADGTSEIIVGAGFGFAPNVKIFRQDGSVIAEFSAYDPGFRGGVNVATCDLDGNGASEIITGAGYSGGPHVRIFSNTGEPIGTGFFAYSETFRGGVNVTCGDITGDGTPEIITGAGVGGGPHIRVFDANGKLIDEIFNGSAADHSGVYVTLGDSDGNHRPEVIASPMTFTAANATLFVWEDARLKYRQALPFGTDNTYGTQLAAWDADQDGRDELAVSPGAFGKTQVNVYETVGNVSSTIENGAKDSQLGLALANLSDTTSRSLIVMPVSTPLADATAGQYIKVDISEQRLTAYQDGVPVNTFLISSGIYGYSTPLGKTTVTDKIPVMDYSWFFGEGDARNYSLPNVKWNLRFRTHYYIHSAYWHNNFGHKMSHGCINTSIPDAEWIYNWANVGATVEIVE